MKLRIWVLGIFMIGCFCSPAYCGMSLTTGTRYDSFNGDPADGTELTIPLGFAYEWDKIFVRLESAYSQADVTSVNEPDGTLSSMTDSRFSLGYLLPDFPVGIRLGLDVNLPSGKSALSELERRAEAGEQNDLFEVDNFGEGLNVGVNLGLAREFGSVGVQLNGAYVVNGEFNPTVEIANDNLDPGDQTLVLAAVNWQASRDVALEVMGAYSHFSKDTIGGEDVFQQGDKLVFGANLRAIYRALRTALSVQYAVHGKNNILIEDALETEPESSNGDEFFGILDLSYAYSASLNLRLLGDLRFYGESDRKDDAEELPLAGQRIRYAVGLGFSHFWNSHISWSVLGKYFILNQDRDVWLEEDADFQGVNLAFGITYAL